MNEVVSDSQNWEQKLLAFVKKYNEQHPIIIKILLGILFFVLQYFASYALDMMLETVKTADVRQEPNTKAALVAHLEAYSEVLAIEERPYYYMIRFEDSETGEKYEGWISKRSVANKSDCANKDESE